MVDQSPGEFEPALRLAGQHLGVSCNGVVVWHTSLGSLTFRQQSPYLFRAWSVLRYQFQKVLDWSRPLPFHSPFFCDQSDVPGFCATETTLETIIRNALEDLQRFRVALPCWRAGTTCYIYVHPRLCTQLFPNHQPSR